MSMELFERIINQIATNAKVIQMYWMGEPLLNPNIYKMVHYCKQHTNAKIIISTNGSLLSKEAVFQLSQNGLDEIIVSVDACNSQKIYSAIRINGNIDVLNKNIEILLQNKGKMHVVLQFIDMFINRSEKKAFIEKWRGTGCDTSISCLYTWANQIPSLQLASDNLSPVRNKKRIPCADLWNKMTINHDGIVSVCCFDWNHTHILGNCETESLFDIWNGQAINMIRSKHEKGLYSQIALCRGCDAWAEPDEYEKMYYL